MHEKEKIYRVCYTGLSLQILIKNLALPGHESPASLKSFIPSFLNPSINVSNPLWTLKSSSFHGFYSNRFVDLEIKELQSRSGSPAVPELPLPFRHWCSAPAQGAGPLLGRQCTHLSAAPSFGRFVPQGPSSDPMALSLFHCMAVLLCVRFRESVVGYCWPWDLKLKYHTMGAEGRLQCKRGSHLAVPPIILGIFDPALGREARADNLPRSSHPAPFFYYSFKTSRINHLTPVAFPYCGLISICM